MAVPRTPVPLYTPHGQRQPHCPTVQGSLALPVQPAQAGLPQRQVLPKTSQGAEDVDQYGPATRFPPPVWPTGYQGPEAIMATGEMQPPPSEFGYLDETMGVAGGPWPLMAYQDGRNVVRGRAVAREQHISLPCLLCAVSLFAMAVAGIFVVFSMYVFTIPWWLRTEETTTSVFETLPGGGQARGGGEGVQLSVNAKRQTASRNTQPPPIWFQTRNYTGVVLRLPESVSASTWRRVPILLGQLAQTLTVSPNTDVRLGVALRQDARGADLRRLAAVLGQVSVFLLPPAMTLPRYMGLTFSYFSESTLASLTKLYTANFGPDHGKSVCYLLPADTYTFQILTPTNQRPMPRQRSIGPGIRGPVTGQQGRMAYFESCRIVADQSYDTLDLQYGAVASRQNSWLSYTKPQMLGRFADALHDNASATCVGLWDPQWDDFASLCGHGAYPLARALFRHYADIHP